MTVGFKVIITRNKAFRWYPKVVTWKYKSPNDKERRAVDAFCLWWRFEIL